MKKTNQSALVSCQWLKDHLETADMKIFDATYFLPRQKRNGFEEFLVEHIPGAQFFDIDRIADASNCLAHMLPGATTFANRVGKLGINNQTRVIVYDNNGFFAAARVWWMFRVYGHENVFVLDGGLARWKQLSFPVESHRSTYPEKKFYSRFLESLLCDLRQMQQYQQLQSRQIADSRSADSFSGNRLPDNPEIRAGHIPGSKNIPYAQLRCSEKHTLLSQSRLEALFKSAGINLHRPIVVTCGSGVSACVLALSLYQMGITSVPVYDGSWAEWGRQLNLPVEVSTV